MICLVDGTNNLIGPVLSWNTVKYKNGIKKLILTDGQQIHRKLEGFDYYYADREALSGISSGIGSSFIGRQTMVTRESIYGIYDLDSCVAELNQTFNNRLKAICSDKKDVDNKLRLCRKRYDILLKKLLDKKITRVSIIIDTKIDSINNFEIDANRLKESKIKPHKEARLFLGKNYGRFLKV